VLHFDSKSEVCDVFGEITARRSESLRTERPQ
jgi:hypothetical protein